MLGLAANLLQNIFHKPLGSVFQILAVYLFAATPCFAGWIANGGKREAIRIPIAGSIMRSFVVRRVDLFFSLIPNNPISLITIFPK